MVHTDSGDLPSKRIEGLINEEEAATIHGLGTGQAPEVQHLTRDGGKGFQTWKKRMVF